MFSCNQNQLKDTSNIYYFKLQYIGNLPHDIPKRLSKLCKKLCKESCSIKLVLNSFKIKSYFSYKDPIPDDLQSFLVYKFTCTGCSSSYICKTCPHFKTRLRNISKWITSLIFLNIYNEPQHVLTRIILFLLK